MIHMDSLARETAAYAVANGSDPAHVLHMFCTYTHFFDRFYPDIENTMPAEFIEYLNRNDNSPYTEWIYEDDAWVDAQIVYELNLVDVDSMPSMATMVSSFHLMEDRDYRMIHTTNAVGNVLETHFDIRSRTLKILLSKPLHADDNYSSVPAAYGRYFTAHMDYLDAHDYYYDAVYGYCDIYDDVVAMREANLSAPDWMAISSALADLRDARASIRRRVI